MKKQGFAAFLRRKQYVIAGAIVVIAAVGTTVLYSSNQEKERQQLEEELAEEINETTPEVAVAEETEEAEAASAVIAPKTEEEKNMIELEDLSGTEVAELPEESAEVAVAEETAAQGDTLHFSPEDGMLWPLEGNVLVNYSMDSTVYFATLDQYKYNPAVIYKAEVGNQVVSCADGVVVNMYQNEELGQVVVLDLGNGYQATYGQLKDVSVVIGSTVTAGQPIANVAEPTIYYSVEGANVYFSLTKDGVAVNPEEMM